MHNHITLIGNLVGDVRLTEAGDNTRASFKLAVNRPGTSDKADFVWVKTWNGVAKACSDHIAKGSRVHVEGALRTSTVKTGDSFKDYVEVNASRVTFLDRKPAGDGAERVETVVASTPEPTEDVEPQTITDDDIPF